MNLPVPIPKRRGLAHCGANRSKSMDNSTNASIVSYAATREYPRTVSVYTIRTPSPGGQHGVSLPLLPTFFLIGASAREQGGAPDVCRVSAAKSEGHEQCQLETLSLHSPPARVLPRAATHWASRLRAARPSARARLSSPATAHCRARPSEPRATWPSASFIPAAVTDHASQTGLYTVTPRVSATRGVFAFDASTSICTAKRTSHVQ